MLVQTVDKPEISHDSEGLGEEGSPNKIGGAIALKMNPFAVPSIVAFHAPLADRCTALHPRFICHRQHSGSVPSESADFRGLLSPLHEKSALCSL